jgi:glycosyltransferase involved in cell wall biosynthesis
MNVDKNNKTPKVTVCVVTYNQEKYIKQCLQSIVDQKADFEFEVIVSDDCSTDNTRQIIIDFASKYKNIKPLLRTENIGALENFIDTHSRGNARYICHMDGDDYWLPTKLQKQVDFLDENEECNLLWTRSLFLREDKLLVDNIVTKDVFNRRFYREDIIKYIAIGTNSSHMYRSKFKIKKRPDFDVVDYYKNVETVDTGYASFVNGEALTVYRVGVGISSSGTNVVNIMLKSMESFKKNYASCNDSLFSPSLLMFYSSMKRKRFTLAFRFLLVSITTFSFKGLLNLKEDINFYKMFVVPS